MHTHTTVTASLMLAAALVASTTRATAAPQSSTLTTLTPLGVYAYENRFTDFQSTAANLAVQPGVGLTVSALANNTSSATLVGFRQGPGAVVSVDVSEQGGVSRDSGPMPTPSVAGTTPSATAARYVPGPHSLLLTLTGKAGSRGLVEMSATGGLSFPGFISGGYEVDIGNDNSNEFQAPLIGFERASMVVQFPASGTLSIRLQSDVRAVDTSAGNFLYKSGLSFQFTPAPLCVARAYGETCGPELTGQVTPSGNDYLFDVKLTKGTANAPGLFLVGSTAIDVPIPGVQCSLLTTPIVTLGFVMDGTGASTWQFRFPQSAMIDVRIQVADLGGGTAKASHGLHAACLR